MKIKVTLTFDPEAVYGKEGYEAVKKHLRDHPSEFLWKEGRDELKTLSSCIISDMTSTLKQNVELPPEYVPEVQFCGVWFKSGESKLFDNVVQCEGDFLNTLPPTITITTPRHADRHISRHHTKSGPRHQRTGMEAGGRRVRQGCADTASIWKRSPKVLRMQLLRAPPQRLSLRLQQDGGRSVHPEPVRRREDSFRIHYHQQRRHHLLGAAAGGRGKEEKGLVKIW